jgi:acyl-coenzyme A synthetase/AMP-(fatty) acid ligase
VVQADDPFKVFVELTVSLLADRPLTLLDSSLSLNSLEVSDEEKGPQVCDIPVVYDPSGLISRLDDNHDNWTLALYTSGTTGQPSRVEQTFEGLTRFVRRGEKHSDDVWAFAYDPTHFAGLQVFFQALFNTNSLINIFDIDRGSIDTVLSKYSITHISATPTFYRTRLQQISGIHSSVKRLTSGGEKFEPSLKKELSDIFPKAEFRNVYALTEAGSLLQSDGEVFSIPDNLKNKVKINEDRELLVNKSLVKDYEGDNGGDWFNTGDIIEYVGDDEEEFKFVGRKTDFVNVGGYRVNPHNIEELINNVEGVVASVVTSRESSVTGNILIAKLEIEEGENEKDVKLRVKSSIDKLEPWQKPRSIKITKKIDTSRTGKRIRQ